MTTITNSGPIDFPLVDIDTYEEYAAISVKSLSSFPAGYFYDPTLNLGTLYFWPIPNQNFELHIIVKEVLPQFQSLTDVITLPPEYLEALLYSLAGRLQLFYQLPVNPGIVALARAAINTLEIANHRVPNLQMPRGLMGTGGQPMVNVGGITEGIFTLDEDVLGP